MKKLTYTGACVHNATILIEGKSLDLRLSIDGEYELPADHPHIKMLISTGLLIDKANNISKK